VPTDERHVPTDERHVPTDERAVSEPAHRGEDRNKEEIDMTEELERGRIRA
jgi:hypothetical protein